MNQELCMLGEAKIDLPTEGIADEMGIPNEVLPGLVEPVLFSGRIQPLSITFAGGSSITMGEFMVEGKPTASLSLSAPGQQPSLIFYVDPISFQPMLILYSCSDGYRTYPLDKVMANIPRLHPHPQSGPPGV
jgi:hypothetical protein